MRPDTAVEVRFRVMGCDAHLVVRGPDEIVSPVGGPSLADRAHGELLELEYLWSRFRDGSELNRLNAAGEMAGLDPRTYALVADALEAWRFTDGRFDPTVLDALERVGYDRSLEHLDLFQPERSAAGAAGGSSPTATLQRAVQSRPAAGAPGPVGIDLDPVDRRICLPAGVRIDLGGIGKGRAADLVASSLLAHGATGVCVNVGGDVRVAGNGPSDGRWLVGVEDPFRPGTDLSVLSIDDGAVATSSRLRRAWRHGDRVEHHLIDPATGWPADRGLAAVTVVARSATWAEVLSKAAFVAGVEAGPALIAEAGAVAVLVADDGTVLRTPGYEPFEVVTS